MTDNLNALKCFQPAIMIEIDGDGIGLQNGTVTGGACGENGTAGTAGANGVLEISFGNIESGFPDPTIPPMDRPLQGEPGYYETWHIENKEVIDHHGPYAIPGVVGERSGREESEGNRPGHSRPRAVEVSGDHVCATVDLEVHLHAGEGPVELRLDVGGCDEPRPRSRDFLRSR